MANIPELAAIKEACRVLPRMGGLNTFDNVAKYIGVPKMALLKFVDANMIMFKLRDVKRGKTSKKVIEEVYLTLADKPGTNEWIAQMRERYANVVNLKSVDNYGYLIAYDLVIDESAAAFLNLKEKVMHIVKSLGLSGPGWPYTIGGFGDSAGCTAKGYKVTEQDVERIHALGFNTMTNGMF